MKVKEETMINKKDLMIICQAVQESEDALKMITGGNMLVSIGNAKLTLLKLFKRVDKKIKKNRKSK